MSKKIKNLIIMFSIVLLTFLTSFYELNGTYFVLCVPFIIALITFKGRYFFPGFVGMLLAALIIDSNILTIVLIISSSISYLFLVILNRFSIPLKHHMAIIGSFFAFVITFMQYYSPLKSEMYNLLIIPVLTYFLCYNISSITIDSKSKEKLSITKKELMFIAFFYIFSFFGLEIKGFDFQVGLVVVLILNYMLIRLDITTGLLATTITTVFCLQNVDNINVLFSFVLLIFSFKNVGNNRCLRALSFLIISVMLCFIFQDYEALKEIILVSIAILVISDKFISYLNNYIIEPKDYELKLYQDSYYKCLNRNKKIQKVMNALELYLQNNPKIKKHSKDIILQDMQFLGGKLKEEDNIHFKEDIYNNLKYRYKNILGLKVTQGYLGDYKIKVEIRSDKCDIEGIKEILESHLNVKLKGKSVSYNYALESHKYFFTNDEKVRFNLTIKQRSKEGKMCGDSYISFNIKNKKYYLISDGMGHGKKASKDSSAALLLLKQFIELGMKVENAIHSCNALMCNKESEKFNTLDLLEYDSFDNKLYLYKNGSGVTYLKKGNVVDKISSENLPLGIIENIKIDKKDISLDYKYIILTSDGFKKDLTDLISKSTNKSTKSITNEILAYEGEKIEDDQTIVVLNVIKSK